MIGQVIRLKIQKDNVLEFEELVGKLMKDVATNEPGSIYDVRHIRGGAAHLLILHFLSRYSGF